MNGRTWLSVSLGHGIRVGRSVADPRLPGWRRFELRHVLQEAAKERGEVLTREDVDFLIDKSMVLGLLDHNGNGDLSELMTGTRDEIIAAMMGAGVGRGERRHGWGMLAAVIAVTMAVAIVFIWRA